MTSRSIPHLATTALVATALALGGCGDDSSQRPREPLAPPVFEIVALQSAGRERIDVSETPDGGEYCVAVGLDRAQTLVVFLQTTNGSIENWTLQPPYGCPRGARQCGFIRVTVEAPDESLELRMASIVPQISIPMAELESVLGKHTIHLDLRDDTGAPGVDAEQRTYKQAIAIDLRASCANAPDGGLAPDSGATDSGLLDGAALGDVAAADRADSAGSAFDAGTDSLIDAPDEAALETGAPDADAPDAGVPDASVDARREASAAEAGAVEAGPAQ